MCSAQKSLTMRYSSGSSFPHAERIATYKVRPRGVWVIQSVEKEWCGGSQQVFDVLLKGVDVLAAGSFGDEAVIVDGVNVLFARHGVAKTSACAVFVADAPGLVTQRLLDIFPVVDIVVKPAGASSDFRSAPR